MIGRFLRRPRPDGARPADLEQARSGKDLIIWSYIVGWGGGVGGFFGVAYLHESFTIVIGLSIIVALFLHTLGRILIWYNWR